MVANKNFDEIAAKAAQDFETNGYAVIEDFITQDEIATMKCEADKLVQEACSNPDHLVTFNYDTIYKNDYYNKSQDKASFFYEPNAIKDGKLVVPAGIALSKIGHALHAVNDTFKQFTCNDARVQALFEKLNFEDPTVVQGMLIFKNPKVGSEFIPHQDAQYLTSDPVKLAGFWYALDDASVENGCLWFIPGSHKWPLARRFVRTGDENGGDLFKWTKPMPDYNDDQFVPAPVKRGSLVILHGLVVHKSAPNTSDKSRQAYAFHAYDKANSEWQPDCWLTPQPTFLPLAKSAKA